MEAQNSKTQSNKNTTSSNSFDFIGKPDLLSNLRPIKFHVSENESRIEKHYRLERARIQKWNFEFWTKHNESFKKEKEEFSKNNFVNKDNENSRQSEEMSVFYKQFLDKNWNTHCAYNIEWYKQNLHLSFLALRVHISRMLKYCKLL